MASSSMSRFCLLLLLVACSITAAVTQPADFRRELVSNSFREVMDIVWLPASFGDNLALLCQRNGIILIADLGRRPVVSQNFLVIPSVNVFGERGLISVVLDPQFESNRFFYTYVSKSDLATSVVQKWQMDTGVGTAARSSPLVATLWTDPDGFQKTGYHFGGQLSFGPDGLLYLSTGDKYDGDFAQNMAMAAGKIIRMTTNGEYPDGGFGIWKIGLRNPFRASWDLPTGRYMIAEVGGNNQQTAWEDLHVVTLNSTTFNFGWPYCEGRPCDRNPDFPLCRCGVHDEPVYSYPHLGRNSGMVGAEVCRSLNFPASYYGVYFFSDYPRKQIRFVRFDSSGKGFGDTVFMSGLSKTNVVRFAPDGTMYFSYLSGELFRVSYTGNLPRFNPNPASTTTTPAPAAVITASSVSKTINIKVREVLSFRLTATNARAIGWVFGDGVTSLGGALVKRSYTSEGVFQAIPFADNAAGVRTFGSSVFITVGTAPTVTIRLPVPAPSKGDFIAGQVINFAGSARSSSGVAIPDANLLWTIEVVHDDHTHPYASVAGSSGSLQMERSGHDTSGKTGLAFTLATVGLPINGVSRTVTIWPRETVVTFATSPAGLSISLDGVVHGTTAPYRHDSVMGFQQMLSTAEFQCRNNVMFQFRRWSHGAAREALYTIPNRKTTITAFFVTTGRSCSSFAATT